MVIMVKGTNNSGIISTVKLKITERSSGRFPSNVFANKKPTTGTGTGQEIVMKLAANKDDKIMIASAKNLPLATQTTPTSIKMVTMMPPINNTKPVLGGGSGRFGSGAKMKNEQVNLIKNNQKQQATGGGKQQSITVTNATGCLHTNKLIKDGRRTPEQYRMNVLAVSSPSQISLKSLTEHYKIPDSKFETTEDVFTYRGYKKLAKIDEGAFGIVSKAIRTGDNLIVAVKEIDLSKKKSKRIEEMRRELFVLQKVDHANVVKLIEHFIVDQTLVIIMEFCAGNNLTSYLKECAIDENEAKNLFRQMALSIKVLHRKGISHRDVKLNNFLLDGKKKLVKVGDFGLSVVSYRRSLGLLMAKTYCGTEPYMAPEILKRNSQGLRSYNPIYADIWSLGVCLFAMLTRTFPFKVHASQRGLIKAQTSRKWRFPRSLRDLLSDELKDLVWHMLDPEPERRISTNGVVTHPWLNGTKVVELSYDERSNNNTPSTTPSSEVCSQSAN